MSKFFTNFLRDESGASAAEYALIIAIVGVGIGAAALSLGANVQDAIGDASTDVYNCNNATGTVGTYDSATADCS
jgi:pilus assembly protein Flp/PilA